MRGSFYEVELFESMVFFSVRCKVVFDCRGFVKKMDENGTDFRVKW